MRCAVLLLGNLAAGGWLALGWMDDSCAAENSPAPPLPVVTNIIQFDSLTERSQNAPFTASLEGVVVWTHEAGRLMVLQDDSGAALVETAPKNPPIRPGQKVAVEGHALAGGYDADIRIGQTLVVDNDGLHGPREKSGTIYLAPGRHPLSVSWLAGDEPEILEVYYEGPGLPRQKIPDSALYRQMDEPGKNGATQAHGLECEVFDGQWPSLPDFLELKPVKKGVTGNVDLSVKTQDKNVAVRFWGDVEIPREGLYAFSIMGNGSRLWVDLPRVRVLGPAVLPEPRRFTPGQDLPPNLKSAWDETEGIVTFAGSKGLGGIQLELTSDTGQVRVEVGDPSGISPEQLLGSRVRVRGICRRAFAPDGKVMAGVMWMPDRTQMEFLEPASQNRTMASTNSAPGRLPVLNEIGQIMQLKREEIMRGYPVSIRGVIIWSGVTACQIQDATAGIYADLHEAATNDSPPPRAGEYYEIEGVTEMRFSPVIVARKVTRLGLGMLARPAHPDMNQLLNGTMDALDVEIQGIVTAVHANRLTMLTSGGIIQVSLVPPMWDGEPSVLNPDRSIKDDWSDAHLAALKACEGALIRVRGSLSPVKDRVTLQFKVGEIQLRAASICVDRAAPADPFDAPAKRAVELLMFDAQAATFQPVKITGQVVQEYAGEYFLMDGNQGLRFVPRQPAALAPGDLVEVAGYPELGGPSPELREASVRKIGQAGLPPPQRLLSDSPLILRNPAYDATRVQLDARLMNWNIERNDQVLELQMGARFFVARLDKKYGLADAIPVGSLLDLTGVYDGHIAMAGQGIDYFELLLNSPSDIRVLSRPSWWTLKRLAGAVGVLAGIIVAASVWISLLRRQVELRTAQLRREIHERETAERMHAIEAERSRIARDLHDDLGSSLTEISMLADAGPGAPPTIERAFGRFGLISQKVRALVNALDVIVWLVNPKKDSLPLLASYLGSYAQEFFAASAIACRQKIPLDLPPTPLSAETRHGIFLAVKEILNNAANHSAASEAVFEMSLKNNELNVTITDNGRGFDPASVSSGNGLSNLRERLARLGGHCQAISAPGKGTTVILRLPL